MDGPDCRQMALIACCWLPCDLPALGCTDSRRCTC
jgi:hypothetical protein